MCLNLSIKSEVSLKTDLHYLVIHYSLLHLNKHDVSFV